MKPFRFDEPPQTWKPILLWVVLFISLLPSRSTEAVELSREGASAMAKGDYDRAIEAYSSAIGKSPLDANGYFGLVLSRTIKADGLSREAASAMAKGDYDRAIEAYSSAISKSPQDANGYFGRGVARRASGERRIASDVEGCHDLARRDFDNAIWDMTEAIRLDPKLALAFRQRGELYGYIHDYQRAVADIGDAIRLNPHDADAYVQWSLVRGRLPDGAPRAQPVPSAPPVLPVPPPRNARREPWDTYDKEFRKYLALEMEWESLQSKVKCIKDKEQSAAPIHAAAASNSKSFADLEMRGGLRIHQGDYERGAADLRAAVALDRNDPAAAFERFPKKDLSREALRYGKEQVRRMLHDRPDMAKYGDKARVLYQWAARKFAGEDLGEYIRWDTTLPAGSISECCPPIYRNHLGFIRLEKPSSRDETQRFDTLWYGAVFELYNIANAARFDRTHTAAMNGELTKDEFEFKEGRIESIAGEKSRSFFINLYLPWVTENRVPTHPGIWRIGCRATCRDSFGATGSWRRFQKRQFNNLVFDGLLAKDSEKARGFVEALQDQASTSEEKAEILVQCGDDFASSHFPDNARECYDRAVRLNPKDSLAHLGRGRLYFEFADFDRALTEFDETVRLDHTNAEAHFARGEVYAKRAAATNGSTRDAQIAKALTDFSEAIRLNPTYVEAYISRGRIFATNKKLDKAISDETDAIRIDPTYPEAFLTRSRVYEEMGEKSKSASDRAEAHRVLGLRGAGD